MATASWVQGDTDYITLDVWTNAGVAVDVSAASDLVLELRVDGATVPITLTWWGGTELNAVTFNTPTDIPPGVYQAQILADGTRYPSSRSPLTFQVHESTGPEI